MSGITTNISPANMSDAQGRMFLIKLRNILPGKMMGKNSDTITVPFHRLSQTLQYIRRAGIHVESVTIISANHEVTHASTKSTPLVCQPTSIPEIDSDEYAADIGGEIPTMELIPG